MRTNHSAAHPVLLERTRQALATGRLPLAVFSDPTLYELEKERIFSGSLAIAPPVTNGDVIAVQFAQLGSVTVKFT